MVFIKDLSRIGRPLNKTIIVDNVAENFSLQPDNGIFIKSWFDDKSDTALLELAPTDRLIVLLSDAEDWRAPEIAAALELSPGAVRTRLSRLRRRLRARLEPVWRDTEGSASG